MEKEALRVLERLVTDDDQSVEAWYLGGWCLFILGEKLREAKGQQQEKNGDGEKTATPEWQTAWNSSRRWLSTCLSLYEMQDYEDERLGEHAVELLQAITKELGEPPEGDDEGEEWEDGSGDEDEGEDDDEEMKD
jgi:hypothetical protein